VGSEKSKKREKDLEQEKKRTRKMEIDRVKI
jgi:hypothetical protein